ncbi:hypothetical protein BV898_06089 [Hypsibius exemplaris]|uniref:Uncharacterized protein n=1 Tax=Hypsibius exemplaris TaxID=2072580 RepID=A0A1W0WX89_HYPEX|nr:hypothetical protein BV898_06089 [Hypsibius exemplaris]
MYHLPQGFTSDAFAIYERGKHFSVESFPIIRSHVLLLRGLPRLRLPHDVTNLRAPSGTSGNLWAPSGTELSGFWRGLVNNWPQLSVVPTQKR